MKKFFLFLAGMMSAFLLVFLMTCEGEVAAGRKPPNVQCQAENGYWIWGVGKTSPMGLISNEGITGQMGICLPKELFSRK